MRSRFLNIRQDEAALPVAKASAVHLPYEVAPALFGRSPGASEVLLGSVTSRRTETWMPHRSALGPAGRFTDQSLVPKDAWFEGLVNAVVHRSYSMAGDHIRVNIFPSRIEIESPGRFPGLADPTRPLDISRCARNPRIARVCSDLGITQERGEGIRRMFEEMRLVGLTDPDYHQTSGSVRLTLTAFSRLNPGQQAALPRGAEETLTALRGSHQPLGTGDLLAATGRSRPWVRAQLEEMRSSGVIHWDETSPRDPVPPGSCRDDGDGFGVSTKLLATTLKTVE